MIYRVIYPSLNRLSVLHRACLGKGKFHGKSITEMNSKLNIDYISLHKSVNWQITRGYSNLIVKHISQVNIFLFINGVEMLIIKLLVEAVSGDR